jgi:hypothetical protein
MEGRVDRLSAFFADNVCGQNEVFQVEAPFCEREINLNFSASQNGEG